MKFIFTCCIAIAMCAGLSAQNYATGSRVITFIDAARQNRQVPTNIYYPAATAGANVPVIPGGSKFPVVVFGHGFVIPASAYQWLADSLVSKGYIVALPTTEGSISPSHTNFGNDLLFLSNYLTAQNDDAASFLYGRVIKKAAVAGHSMGGGASFLAAANTSAAIAAIFNFAAAETNPSASSAALLINKPALIFSGSGDCIVPAATQQQMYTNVAASCKAYVNITDALHCQFANNNGTCSLGQLVTGCNSSSITPAVVFNKTVSVLLPFLDFYLKDSCTRGFDYINTLNNITGATKIVSCNTIPECGVLPVNIESFKGALVNKAVQLNWASSLEDKLAYYSVEKSYDGISFQSFAKVLPANTTGSTKNYAAIDGTPFAGNCYYRLKIFDKDGSYTLSVVVKINTPLKKLSVIQVAPNPVINNVAIKILAAAPQKIFVRIHNATGQTKLNATLLLNTGENIKNLPLASLPAGLYVLTLKDSDAVTVGSFKILKQ